MFERVGGLARGLATGGGCRLIASSYQEIARGERDNFTETISRTSFVARSQMPCVLVVLAKRSNASSETESVIFSGPCSLAHCFNCSSRVRMETMARVFIKGRNFYTPRLHLRDRVAGTRLFASLHLRPSRMSHCFVCFDPVPDFATFVPAGALNKSDDVSTLKSQQGPAASSICHM
jgi:hypothetical protein